MTGPQPEQQQSNITPSINELESAINSLQRQMVSLTGDMSPFMALFGGSKVNAMQSELNTMNVAARQAKKALDDGTIGQKDYNEQMQASRARMREMNVDITRFQLATERNAQAMATLVNVHAALADGIRRAGDLSITAQEGVGLMFRNQASALSSMFTLDPNKMVRPEEMYAVQQGVVTALGGLRSGLELSADGVQSIISDMRTGLRSQIIPTAETFRTLSFMGLKPTIEDMNKLREATGRAAIGAAQMDVLNRNRQALIIFGTQLSKTALDFDRVGVSLAQVLAAGQGYVTNLEGSIDAIAQLNQLGTNIDFGQLTMLMEFNPAEAQKYIAANISKDQLQSSSFRALVQSLPGANIDTILALKGMDKLQSDLESAGTKQKESSGTTEMLTKAVGIATNAFSIVSSTLLGTGISLVGLGISSLRATIALNKFSESLNVKAGTPPSATSQLPDFTKMKTGMGSGALVGGAVGLFSGVDVYQQTKSVWKAVLAGAIPMIGGVLGGMLGIGISAIPGMQALAPIIVPLMSGLGASLAAKLTDSIVKMDDGISTPEAGRTLTTSAGTFALNPQDTVIAGTNLVQDKPQPQQAQVDITPLMKKMESLIDAIASANTTIEVDGALRTVNRIQLVGVYTRDETVRSI